MKAWKRIAERNGEGYLAKGLSPMPKTTFDTNIIISRKPPFDELPQAFYPSIVVIQELVAGAKDETDIKLLATVRWEFEKVSRLLVPTSDDWWEVGRIINLLQRGQSHKGGLIPKMTAEKYRITNDVLIARTARREGVTVITDSAKDFERIKNFCNVRIMSGDEYFGSKS